MTDKQSKLNELLVDEEELNEELLFEVLSDYIRIGSESGNLVTQAPFRELNANQKVLVVLLSQKARTALDLAESEWMTPTEISNTSGMKKGTIYPVVRKLAEDLNIAEDDDGSYRIPSYNLDKARNLVRGDAE